MSAIQIEKTEEVKKTIAKKMFCNQCQETIQNIGCTTKGACGKDFETANLQDLLVYTTKGVAECLNISGHLSKDANKYIIDSLFMTVTNTNFDKNIIADKIREGLHLRDSIKENYICKGCGIELPDSATWYGDSIEEFEEKANSVGILATENEDVRSLRLLTLYGLKGLSAYLHHAMVLDYDDLKIHRFVQKALISLEDDSLSADELTALVLKCGKFIVDTMALLDKANTETYGNPVVTEVNLGVRNNPGILISGHDLKDMQALLEQTQGTGIDVYTHSEMLPAHYYPAFKKYENFAGNYGGAWWDQRKEFESFNGPILMTTNCIVKPSNSYIDRIYTTSVVNYPGVKHIFADADGKKDFSELIELAKTTNPPKEIETGTIVGGFAHNQVFALAEKVVDAVKTGAVKKFFVMAGCDGRHKSREYYTEFAEKLPKDTIILTAGCAKYRYNKLDLGDIGGIPRVLDAGQCNDCYSLAVIALKLQEVFELEDINDLPIEFNIAWYEQKAAAVLLALLHLGIKNIHIGPTLPAFVSPNVLKVLIDAFKLGGTSTVDEDLKMFIEN